jgi:hypothetical protein
MMCLKGLIECGGEVEGTLFYHSKWYPYWEQYKDLFTPCLELPASGPNMSSRWVPPRFNVALGKLILEEWERSKAKSGNQPTKTDEHPISSTYKEGAPIEPSAPPLTKPVIWYHGDRCYSLDGQRRKSVPKGEHDILQRFLDRDIALTGKELPSSNPSAAVSKLIEKFPGTIDRPPEKGDGYVIRVRSKAMPKN